MENTNLVPSFAIITNQNKPPPPPDLCVWRTTATPTSQRWTNQHFEWHDTEFNYKNIWNIWKPKTGALGPCFSFLKGWPFSCEPAGFFGFAIHLQKVIDFFTTHRRLQR